MRHIDCYDRNTYKLFLNTHCDYLTDLTFNCSGMQLDHILAMGTKISKCTKLKKIHITNISNQYFSNINFNFLADFGIGDINISSTFPAIQITNFTSYKTQLILANLQTYLDIGQIISTNFRTNTKIYVRPDKFKEVAIIMNNLNTNVHNLKIHFIIGSGKNSDNFDEICNFINSSLDNLPNSLVNLKFYYKKTIFNRVYYDKIIERLKSIKTPFGCNLIIKNYSMDKLL